MRSDPQSFFRFVQQSPTAFHAVRTVSAQLEAAGFRYLDETECWQLAAGGKYYTTKNNSALIALLLFFLPSLSLIFRLFPVTPTLPCSS